MDVSVVIPTYNRPELLADALESVLQQTVTPREIVVVDNGTNDETRSLLEARYAGAVVYVRMPPEGVQAARNAGMDRAQGEWVANLDDDDLWHPEFLESARPIVSDGRADLIYADFRKFLESADRTEPFARTNFENAPPGYWNDVPRFDGGSHWSFIGSFPLERLLRYNAFYPSAMLAKRNLFEGIGGYNPAVRGIKSEDMEFTTRALISGKLAVIWRQLVDYRVHASNSCANDQVAQALGRWRIFEYVYAQRAYGSDRLLRALEEDLPDRRARAFDRAWRNSRFAVAEELRPLLRDEDWTFIRRLRWLIQGSPTPIRSAAMELRKALPRNRRLANQQPRPWTSLAESKLL